MKLEINFLIIALIVLTVFTNSCRKPHYDCCTWTKKITNMHSGICKMQTTTSYEDVYGACVGLDSLDSCKYNLLKIGLSFESIYLSQDYCSSPKDSLVGKIDNITIISKYHYNNIYQVNDTINDIINLIDINIGQMPISTPVSLNYYLGTKPICTHIIRFFLSQPPDTTAIQSFEIRYTENDGTTFSATTKPIYITP